MTIEVPTGLPPDGGPAGRIGPYRLVRVLGEGGMGVVYLAEQTEPVRRDVALKLLKPGMDTRQVVARFEAERQALAVMEHPGIARVFDAGATETGRPYFVMERVDGVPITDYCDAHRLGVRERVRLFGQVCRAVQHAHQKGVIHRDLKPSNVLVTVSDGTPLCKIIDFGIARAVERTGDEHTLLTHAEQSLGTPAYMSPEQVDAAGRDIDTRSDIYSLGVLLYELLAGVLPFEPQAYRGWAFHAQHLVREPTSPSVRFAGLDPASQSRIAALRRVEPAALRRQVRGELDWVVLRALERDRDRRYDTANGLAVELDRYLANEPVLASPPSRAYRARKFVRRHRGGVAFAAVVAVLLIGFAGAMGVQAERVAYARDLAVARQGQAEDLIGFMLGDLRDKLTPVGRLDILDDVGQRALGYFAAVPETELSDAELFRRAEAVRQLGEVRLDQGNLDGAKAALGSALSLTRGLAARDPRNAEWQLGLGTVHFWVGEVLRRQGDLDGALHEFTAYRDIARALVERDPSSLDWQQELAYGYANVGAIAYERRDLQTAVAELEHKLVVQQRLVAVDTSRTDLLLQLGDDHNFLGAALEESGDLAGARRHMLADLALKRDLLARDTANTRWRHRLGASLNYLARNSGALGLADSALSLYREELVLRTDLAARDPANALWRRNLGFASARVGRELLSHGQADDAGPLLRRAVEISEELAASAPTQVAWRMDVAWRYRDLAELALHQGRGRDAVAASVRALAVIDSILAESPANVDAQRALGVVHGLHGSALAAAHDAAGARAAWSRAAEILEPFAAGSREWLVLDPYARVLLHLGRDEEARAVIALLDELGYRDRSFSQAVRSHRAGSGRTPR